jgi:hypothetical protein
MALPSLNTPKHELTLPSTGEKVEYRPFLVKEEKLLLMAQEANDETATLKAVEQIVDACTFGKLNVKTIPVFDLEYVFIQLRAKSVGETSSIKITCPDDMETKVEVTVNLEDITCVKQEGHDNKIQLTDEIGMIMDYPKIDSMTVVDTSKPESVFDLVRECIAQIYDTENVYERNDMSSSDLDNFLDSMSHSQFEQVQEFFNTMPKVQYKTKVKNPETGVESDIVIEGMQNFF